MVGTKQWKKKDGKEHRVLLELFATSIIHPGNWSKHNFLKKIHSNITYPFHRFSERVFLTKVKEIVGKRQRTIELGASVLASLSLFFSF